MQAVAQRPLNCNKQELNKWMKCYVDETEKLIRKYSNEISQAERCLKQKNEFVVIYVWSKKIPIQYLKF